MKKTAEIKELSPEETEYVSGGCGTTIILPVGSGGNGDPLDPDQYYTFDDCD